MKKILVFLITSMLIGLACSQKIDEITESKSEYTKLTAGAFQANPVAAEDGYIDRYGQYYFNQDYINSSYWDAAITSFDTSAFPYGVQITSVKLCIGILNLNELPSNWMYLVNNTASWQMKINTTFEFVKVERAFWDYCFSAKNPLPGTGTDPFYANINAYGNTKIRFYSTTGDFRIQFGSGENQWWWQRPRLFINYIDHSK